MLQSVVPKRCLRTAMQLSTCTVLFCLELVFVLALLCQSRIAAVFPNSGRVHGSTASNVYCNPCIVICINYSSSRSMVQA